MGPISATVPESAHQSTHALALAKPAGTGGRLKAAARAACDKAKRAGRWLLGLAAGVARTLGALASKAVRYARQRVTRSSQADQESILPTAIELSTPPEQHTARAPDEQSTSPEQSITSAATLEQRDHCKEGNGAVEAALPTQHSSALSSGWPFRTPQGTTPRQAASNVSGQPADPGSWCFHFPAAIAGQGGAPVLGDMF